MPFVNALQCLALVKLIIKATVTVATFVMINIIYVECTHCSYSGRLNFGKLIHKKYLQNLMFIL